MNSFTFGNGLDFDLGSKLKADTVNAMRLKSALRVAEANTGTAGDRSMVSQLRRRFEAAMAKLPANVRALV